jgi:osmotically-inducible protein OsmY
MKSASELQHDVLHALNREPELKAGEVGVSVHNGVVTLTGHVHTYPEKDRAEKAAKGVVGVSGVANDLVVKQPSGTVHDDTDIAEAAVHALKWTSIVPAGSIQVAVRNGWITLEGEVEWFYQKEAAIRAVRGLPGVTGISSLIIVTPRVTAEQVTERIEAAFQRSAKADARAITVEVIGTKAILHGRVTSWQEYEEAEWVAWSAPGIAQVENKLDVEENVSALAAH